MSEYSHGISQDGAAILHHGIPMTPEEIVLKLNHYADLERQLDAANARAEELEDRLVRSGFVRCDLPACNCGSWHQRYGLPERMAEIRTALADAGHPPCNDNGNLISNALNELIQENDELRSRNHEAREIYTGMEGFVPETAPEGYCLRIIEQMYSALAAARGE